MTLLAEAFWFFLPAGVANMSPVLANKLPLINRWTTPLDLGKTHSGKRLLGDNKTWRGVVFGTFMGMVTSGLVHVFIYDGGSNRLGRALLIGALLGLGALLGDAVESFFKRRHGVAPGRSWFPFDQTDYIIGGLVLTYPLLRMPALLMSTVLLLYFTLHLVFAYVGFLIGFKDKPI